MKTANRPWFVYLLRCNDNSLYAGVTTDIKRRIDEHNTSPLGAKYTRARRPVTLVYLENATNRSSAGKQEYQLRKLPKYKKEQKAAQYLQKSDN